MTPMIDIVFLLLIFFVCASVGQVRESLLPTELSSGTVSTTDPPQIKKPLGEAWVRLRRQGGETRIEVESRMFSGPGKFEQVTGFLATLAAAAPEIPVILDIGGEVPLGEALRTYDACRAARFDSVHFAVDPPRPPSEGT